MKYKQIELKDKNYMDQQTLKDIKLDQLAKVLLRCKKFYDAKHEIVRILVNVRKWENAKKDIYQELLNGKRDVS